VVVIVEEVERDVDTKTAGRSMVFMEMSRRLPSIITKMMILIMIYSLKRCLSSLKHKLTQTPPPRNQSK
jgi:hypothetical protein